MDLVLVEIKENVKCERAFELNLEGCYMFPRAAVTKKNTNIIH